MPYKNREAQLAFYRRYNEKNREKRSIQRVAIQKARRANDQEFAERIRAYSRARYRMRSKEVGRAHNAVARAIRKGELVRPERCSRCGEKNFIEAAHNDYTKPLDVTWLCRSCHRREDHHNPKAHGS